MQTATFKLKRVVKTVLRNVAPQSYGSWMSRRSNRHARRVLERDGVPALARQIVATRGLRVAAGPFRGMQYVEASVGSVFIPKLLGCYECELHPAIERALGAGYDVVVDVGCAEGYYAVGLAMRLPEPTRVFAYDTDPAARAACSRLAQHNGVAGRVEVGGFCEAATLRRVLRGRTLIVCDCEGYEVDLLDPLQVPALVRCDMIVELHDLARPGITATLLARFAATHRIELVWAAPRDPADYPLLDALPVAQRASAVSEYRGGPQQWALMTAQRKPSR